MGKFIHAFIYDILRGGWWIWPNTNLYRESHRSTSPSRHKNPSRSSSSISNHPILLRLLLYFSSSPFSFLPLYVDTSYTSISWGTRGMKKFRECQASQSPPAYSSLSDWNCWGRRRSHGVPLTNIPREAYTTKNWMKKLVWYKVD